jgi:HPt (histidine-containing phosphotransfer) domain-containing protein
MKGDEERFLKAGMDGYLSKPIVVGDLLAMIERLVPPRATIEKLNSRTQGTGMAENDGTDAGPEDALARYNSATEPDTTSILNLKSLLARVEDDWELLHELVKLCLDNSPALLNEIDAGLARQDAPTVERAAHAMKGSMQNMAAPEVARAAAHLEDLGRRGELAPAEEAMSTLRREYDRLAVVLTSHSLGAQP